LLVIECGQMGAAIAALRHEPGVHDVAAFGNTLHVLVADGSQALQSLPVRFAALGLALDRIARIDPTLEDIFVHLVGADGAQADAKAGGAA